ncbi:MAG TPA: hypothetical protein VJN18_06900 [Polyangiaceae bacterium]|nr:hypothetical protein [Polyangiaceae bacterium]
MVLLSALTLSCGVPAPPDSRNEIEIPEAGKCGRGFVVVESNYESTNVGLLTVQGDVLTGSLVASTLRPSELVPSLSGDVVSSSSSQAGLDAVLIDRAADSSRLAFVDLSTGRINKYVSLGTGFASYPQDYAEVSPSKAYVTRFGHNRRPGRVPFDAGSDIIVLSRQTTDILGSIDLRVSLGEAADSNLPRASRIALADDKALVLLTTLPVEGYVATAESRLAVVDTGSDTVDTTLILTGLRNCAGMAINDARDRIAIFCSALLDANGSSDPLASGIALVTLHPRPRIERVITSDLLGPQPVGFDGGFASADVLLVTSFGAVEGNEVIAQDRILSVNFISEEVKTLLTGAPFSLGGVECAEACGTCLVTDAARNGGVVHRYVFVDQDFTLADTIKVETEIGLPPRELGRF